MIHICIVNKFFALFILFHKFHNHFMIYLFELAFTKKLNFFYWVKKVTKSFYGSPKGASIFCSCEKNFIVKTDKLIMRRHRYDILQPNYN